ncbi:sensor histidine kinase [Rhodanobacter glycinis]|uniref:Sensor histidine kinase n=1 Tax=Rhodanobacter glycinis TaxID=582702 RepID=A0A502CAT5_9GAMM|nr:histidine kinase [Rhodanobacter glycinis]TPG09800.1 sensor histidine kinase [Rhodanobacter glycinis]TPG46705.1 sensor histidine kinase [Rhodanobacter glycinis]
MNRAPAVRIASENPVPDYITSRGSKTWGLAFAFWTLLALSYALSSGLSALSEGHDPSWLRGLTWNAADFYLWMVLAPAIGWLGRRSAGRSWPRFLLLHAPASLGMALAQTVLQLLIFWTVSGPGKMPVTSFGGFVHMEFAYKFQQALVIYWVILAVLRGMESRRHLRDERLRRTQLETQLAQSQLQALRMQLQPHFLFNTLNAISALALADPLQARLMIARLSDFLRLTLEERHAPQVPLSRELEFLTCYLDIQQVRFQDRLSTRLDVADDTLDAAVPNLILQPLVENALRHGLQDKPGAGILRVSIRRDGDQLQLRVDDDGLGLPPAGTLEGIGLGNTRSRLRMLFGDAAGLELSAIPGGGTRAEVRLPYTEHAA